MDFPIPITVGTRCGRGPSAVRFMVRRIIADALMKKFYVLAAMTALILAGGCSREKPAGPSGEKANPGRGVVAYTRTADSNYAATLPKVGGPPGYVGSKECRSCHEEQFESWHLSYHRTMTQIASTNSVQANFHNVTLTNDGIRFALSQKGDEFRVNMRRMREESGGAANQSVDVRIGLVTGSHHMQVFWVPGDQGNTQLGFPFTWLIPERRWVPRNSTFVRPPEAVHRAEIWNIVCSRCHATGIEPRVDSATRTVDTRAAELGISCEACHGPGQRHVIARKAAQSEASVVESQTLREEIVHPKKIDPDRSAQICGFCHSMKWIDKAESWRQSGFRFRPGDDLEQTTPIIRLSRIGSVPSLAEYLARNPDLLRDFFWEDGMIRVSGREYNGLIESPCHKGGEFSCVSCHSLHESDPEDQLARNRTGNSACTQCHKEFREEARLTAHSHHRPGSPGSECYNCHMPHTTYGVLKAIRSHQVSSPSVAGDLATGRPNACNLCHLDRSLSWASDNLAEWYRRPKPALPEDLPEIPRALHLALSGDAGQRSLIAWHLSWPSALQVSGTNWIAPVLGQLLDDPYAAVRLVAERSLRAISNLTPDGYDFVADPLSRQAAREAVWESWQRTLATMEGRVLTGRIPLINPENLASQRAAFDERLRLRNNQPIRLRE